MQRYVVFYESADDVMSKAPAVYPRHLARLKESTAGTFGWLERSATRRSRVRWRFSGPGPPRSSLSDDPFVSEGVVKAWTLREWDEVASEI